jgi:hypothetical protein
MVLMLVVLLLLTDPTPAETTPARTVATGHVVVTDRDGSPLQSAHVLVSGISSREGNTDTAGRVTFANVKEGDYKLTVDRKEFITLQKEFTVDTSRESVTVGAELSRASVVATRER